MCNLARPALGPGSDNQVCTRMRTVDYSPQSRQSFSLIGQKHATVSRCKLHQPQVSQSVCNAMLIQLSGLDIYLCIWYWECWSNRELIPALLVVVMVSCKYSNIIIRRNVRNDESFDSRSMEANIGPFMFQSFFPAQTMFSKMIKWSLVVSVLLPQYFTSGR